MLRDISLRPITPVDITHIHRGLSHPEVIHYNTVRYDAEGHRRRWMCTPPSRWVRRDGQPPPVQRL
jgi:hypothetical protein